jgi:hypothetical protein
LPSHFAINTTINATNASSRKIVPAAWDWCMTAAPTARKTSGTAQTSSRFTGTPFVVPSAGEAPPELARLAANVEPVEGVEGLPLKPAAAGLASAAAAVFGVALLSAPESGVGSGCTRASRLAMFGVPLVELVGCVITDPLCCCGQENRPPM